jgi:lipopolysaccharide transport system permease protein
MEELIIDSGHPSAIYWKEIWRYRGLLYFLAWRDIIVRYKQTVIGFAWAILPPVVTAFAFTVIFNKFAHLSSSRTPYPILVLAGTLPWALFSNALSQGGNSVVSNSHLITKVYFPRFIIPLSAIVVSLVDFFLSCTVLLGVMAWYRYLPDWRIITLPLFLLLALLTSLAFGIWLAALNVRYRDIRYVIPFMIQVGIYISPVGFSSAIVPPAWRWLYSLNPMVGVIDGFRWALLRGDGQFYLPSLCLSLCWVTLLLVTGVAYFRRVEALFTDVI